MNFKYLTDADPKEITTEICEYVKKHCAPFLAQSKKYLYRGIRTSFSTPKIWDVAEVKKDRKPKDTPECIHNYMDNAFQKKFGEKFRSKAMFCTGIPTIANSFGTLYIVFPIGKFDFISSMKVDDLYLMLRNKWEPMKKIIGDYEESDSLSLLTLLHYDWAKNNNKFSDESKRIMDKIVDLYEKNTKLNEFITKGNEIMIICNKYVLIDDRFYSQNSSQFNSILRLS